MPDGEVITLVSTSDTLDEVQQALGIKVEDRVTEVVPEPEKAIEAAPEVVPEVVEVTPDATTDDDEVVDEAPKKKPSVRLQQRIDELVKATRRAEADRDAERVEKDALKAKVAELVAGKPEKVDTAETVAPAKKPTVDQYDTYEEFTFAVAEWTADQVADKKIAARAQADTQAAEAARKASDDDRAKTARETALVHYKKITAEASEKYDDYAEVVSNPDLQVSNLVLDLMMGSDLGAEVAYYLGNHPDECKALLAKGNGASAAAAYGRIEARVEDTLTGEAAPEEATTKVAAPVKKVVTKAPDPIVPVKPETKSPQSPDDMSYQDWAQKRNKDRRARGLVV